MTAPAPAFFLAPDPDGQMTLWADDGLPTPVAWLDGQRLHVDPTYAGRAWQALTRVLAPDDATIERLARAVHDADCMCAGRVHGSTGYSPHHENVATAVLAALAAAPGPDIDDEAVSEA